MSQAKSLYENRISKVGSGNFGGKAEGLKLLAGILDHYPELHQRFPQVDLIIPQTLVLATDGFDTFVDQGGLKDYALQEVSDSNIAEAFLKTPLPQEMESRLRTYVAKTLTPLAVRSSSLLEDARYQAYAGLYNTYMLPNDHPDPEQRLKHLMQAVKLIYASTYFEAPKSFSRRVGHSVHREKMAVIIQHAVGSRYGEFYYPALSGVAQSYNYYPFAQMKPEEGIATIVMGLGRMVVEGEQALRFSPKYPKIMPQRADVADILKNAQRCFYCMKMEKRCRPLTPDDGLLLVRRDVTEAQNDPCMQWLVSTYDPNDHRIRDTAMGPGLKLLTFAQILKFGQFPLAEILMESLKLGKKEMGCQVEMEFSVNLNPSGSPPRPQFAFLQIRPMSARVDQQEVTISNDERTRAFCRSGHALGNTFKQDMRDIVWINPETFDARYTTKMAQEIRVINAELVQKGRRYILIGPGRWGSKDPWLGIPVTWRDISGVGAIVETYSAEIRSEPSQGSHFFHNISTIGINYLSVDALGANCIDWSWLYSQSYKKVGDYVLHLPLTLPLTLKVDGRRLEGVIYL